MARQSRTIFYSWQSDLPNATNRAFIQAALDGAAAKLGDDPHLAVDPVIDRDTKGRAGSPEIVGTIFEKIEAADVFVADVSLITPPDASRPSPNPNVLLELGFAIRAKNWDRIILVMNTEYGGPTELPFDLRGRRISTYTCKNEFGSDKSVGRKGLESVLKDALRTILELLGKASAATVANGIALPEIAREFQRARLEQLSRGTYPVDLVGARLVCLHVVPSHTASDEALDVAAIQDGQNYLAPVGSTGYNHTFNGDGLLRYSPDGSRGAGGYVQIFRDGRLESVDARMIEGTVKGREDGLPSTFFARSVATFVQDACRLFRVLGVRPPIAVRLSLLGVRGVPLITSAGIGGGAYNLLPFKDNNVVPPEIVLNDLSGDVRPHLRRALDHVWQHAGMNRCDCYDESGKWTLGEL